MVQMKVLPAQQADQAELLGQQGAVPAPRVRRVPQRQGPTVKDILDSVKDDLLMFQRAYAGYTGMIAAYNTFHGQVPEGERTKAMPIMSSPGSVDGRDMIEVRTDLKRLRPEYVDYVLPSFIYIHGEDMLLAAEALVQHAQAIAGLVTAALEAPQTQQPQAPAASRNVDADETLAFTGDERTA